MSTRYRAFRSEALSASTITTVMDSSARRVLRNTYMLLAMCLGFSALTASLSVTLQLPYPGILLTLIGFYGLYFLIIKNRNSGAGVALCFALTGFMGYTIGPLIGLYMNTPNGGQTVATALGGTALVFITMSAYGLVSKRDLSFMGNMLFIGLMVAFFASLAALFLQIPALHLAVSALFVLLSSCMIMFETNNIVRGGETNYILATVTLFVSIYNIFVSLLQILGFANSSD